ncbi:indole-3-glycerol phosphate synthase [Desulfobulbus propionicus DSM 2032]|uniref:Indole-3-glycerol phosphate synthase n=1 Tax=Desulfobulbus propionicus (strain ATCC 33891 / DSM 2032 / VKM B-1956 / 1pr3) TaxID=577650 RepID=A0A7U3YLF9_DESPD|nr:indole-3-glycerol phosphate synthase TrpC [Desulfobulbus propionicus]ADW17567.1 indole-3-glycerol phosphate synthase [Desulfobulbus propionicus DSM 2032]
MILDTIVARKQEEVAALKRRGLPQRNQSVEPPRGFIRALVDAPGVAIIAEAKKASPSKGVIQPDFDPVRIARAYQTGGAHCLSVLTDVDFFQGSLDYIPLVRSAVSLPVLRKDFLIDPLQIEEAHAVGADAILLIAAILDPAQLRDYRLLAESLGMDALIEVHDEYELDMALAAESRLIGINNRNLNDFTVSLETTFRLLRNIPQGTPVVSESGITTVADMQRLKEAGVKAALIGESLMRAGKQDQLLREFLAA